MKPRCRSLGRKPVVAALLPLSFALVATLFLAYDLGDLFAEQAPPGDAVLHSKKAHDDDVSPCVSGPMFQLDRTWVGQPVAPRGTQVRTCEPLHVPLRV